MHGAGLWLALVAAVAANAIMLAVAHALVANELHLVVMAVSHHTHAMTHESTFSPCHTCPPSGFIERSHRKTWLQVGGAAGPVGGQDAEGWVSATQREGGWGALEVTAVN